jgi:ankyrin repeat protein
VRSQNPCRNAHSAIAAENESLKYQGGESDGFLLRIKGNLSDESDSEFHDAAKRNDLNKVKQRWGGNKELLETRDKYGRTALHSAARYGAIEVCQYLIEQRADLNARDESGNTPLHLASIFRHDDVAILLTRSKADINALNNDSASPLSVAIVYGTPNTTKFLLGQNADRRVEDKYGNTILYLAAYYGYSEKVKEILKYQPEIDKRNLAGQTPLPLAVQWTDNAELLKDLFNHGANSAFADSAGKNLFHIAFSAFYSSTDKLDILLEKIPEVNASDGDGDTLLHHVMFRVIGSRSLTSYGKRLATLMNRGADPEIKNKEGKSAMDLAVESGLPEAVDLLKAKKKIRGNENEENGIYLLSTFGGLIEFVFTTK